MRLILDDNIIEPNLEAFTALEHTKNDKLPEYSWKPRIVALVIHIHPPDLAMGSPSQTPRVQGTARKDSQSFEQKRCVEYLLFPLSKQQSGCI